MKKLTGTDAIEYIPTLVQSLLILAEGLEATDLEFMLENCSDPTSRDVLLAAQEFMSGMVGPLARGRGLH